jgi:uncharacterized protein (TIGR02453 family)
MSQAHFGPELFDFLRALTAHNDRDWFQAHKDDFERHVQQPMLAFIGDFGGPLRKISKHFVADPRPNGGSMFRIYRDTRFSKDKTPYKTHAAAWFKHERAKDVHAPGFYLHLGPGEVFMGAGVWHPEPATIGKIRDAIVADPKKLTRMLASPKMKGLEITGDALKRPPKGYDADHPLIEHLKRKDWVVSVKLEEADATAAGFLDRFAGCCAQVSPMVKYLCEALEVAF